MRLTVIGSGDAFGSGGRAQSCFWLECGEARIAVDFGATSLVELRRRRISLDSLDAIFISHLHGDHFGGIPFLLLDAQFASGRTRPLTIVGPPGTAERLRAATEILFPGCGAMDWRFPLAIEDLPVGRPYRFGEVGLETREVVHPCGAPPTALRIAFRDRILGYSGDTSWTDALLEVAAGADLFIVECYRPDGSPFAHGALDTIVAHRAELTASRIMLTHMSDAMLDRMDEARAAGFLLAHDGLVLDI